jgi:hypothetical protein
VTEANISLPVVAVIQECVEIDMSIMKDLFIEEYDKIMSEAEEKGLSVHETKVGKLAYERSIDRFADMCDEAKDRAKYV